MKKYVFLLGFFLLIKSAYSQMPKADFDFTVEYHCGWASVGLINKSIDTDFLYWDLNGLGNYQDINNPNPPLGNLYGDHDLKISLIAKKNDLADTITKTFELRQTSVSFDIKVQDTLQMAPLLVEFINNSKQEVGDSLTYKWEFDDGTTSSMKNPSHVYSSPKTYYARLTATTKTKCELYTSKDIIVKDTAQRNEFEFILSGCNEYEPPCGYDKHFVIINDTLKMSGFYSGNCCTHKTATLRSSGDTIFVRTFQSGPMCTCGCGFCFSINVPNIHKDSVIVSFDGTISHAKLLTSTDQNFNDYSFEIYPNPCSDYFYINGIQAKRIELTDIKGKTQRLKIQDPNCIDLNGIKPGVYVVTIFTDTGKWSEKIIKE